MKRALLLLTGLVLAGCNYDARMATFCHKEGTCECDSEGTCCITVRAPCEGGLCCDGLTCAPDGKCHSDRGELTFHFVRSSNNWPIRARIGDRTLFDFSITNDGYGETAALHLSLTGAGEAASIVGGSCEGQALPPGGQCNAALLLTPQRGEDFFLTVTAEGAGMPASQIFRATSLAVCR
jgi:hypothetical protein